MQTPKLHIVCQFDGVSEIHVVQGDDLGLFFCNDTGSVCLSAADEARLLALLLERAGGIQNMALESTRRRIFPTCNCPRCSPEKHPEGCRCEWCHEDDWENSATPCPGCGTICSAGFEFCNRCSDECSDESSDETLNSDERT